MSSKPLLQFTILPKIVNDRNCQKNKVLTEKGQLWCKANAVKLWRGSNEAQIVTCCNSSLKNWKQLINSKLKMDIPVIEELQIHMSLKTQRRTSAWDPTRCCCFRNEMVFLQKERRAMSSRAVTRYISLTAEKDWVTKK